MSALEQAIGMSPVVWAIIVLIGMVIVVSIVSRLFTGVIYQGSALEGDAASAPDGGPSLVDQVMRSGSMVATGMCSGKIGAFHFGSSLRVDVHPAGIVLKPMMMPVMVLLREEITAVQPSEIRLPRSLVLRGLEISHTSPRITASLRLACAEDSDLSKALLALAPPALAA